MALAPVETKRLPSRRPADKSTRIYNGIEYTYLGLYALPRRPWPGLQAANLDKMI